MARPTKQGLDYFPFDVGFFGSNEIRVLKAHYRANGIAVYVRILCDVYGAGYYLSVVDWEDYVGLLADELSISTNAVEQIIAFLQRRAMIRVFKKEKGELTGLDVDAVITSHGIQKRYAAAMKSRRRKSVDEIKRGFWLLSEEEERELNAFYNRGNNEGFYGNNPNYYGNNPNKYRKNDINKSKSSTCTSCTSTSTTSTYIRTEEEEKAKERFFQTYPQLKPDGVDDSCISYVKLLDAFARSKKHLQTSESFSWVVSVYEKILAGNYKDFARSSSSKNEPTLPPAVQAANERAARERFYALRKNAALEKAAEVLKRANESAEFSQANDYLNSKMEKQIARAEIELERASSEEERIFAQEKLAELEEKKSKLLLARKNALSKMGLTERDLLPKWHCKKCSDTGFLPNGRACDCYKEGENV